MAKAILPNSTIGVFGSGQLGRMFAIEARKLGYRVHTFSPDQDTPTGQVADIETVADYDDLDAVRAFASSVDVITFEFENVLAEAAKIASEYVEVRPKGEVLYITQNRLREKRFLKENALPVADFRQINLLDDLYRATGEIGFPCVLKTAGYGYDGKGQTMLREPHDIEPAFAALAGSQAVLEKFIDFEKEVSIIAVRGINGEFAHYGLIENEHRNHILDISVAPARVPESVVRDAVEIARTIAEKFDYIGTFCVEFFLGRDGNLLVNEIAPRPHNSGHLTFDVCIASQFEQQVRAVCGLPLGSTSFQSPAAMANLLGDLWETGEPDWQSALAYPEVKLHLYGKSEPRPGRKMGHLTAIAETVEKSEEIVKAARRRLAAKPLAEAGR